jgi:ParB family chromosome partitioning protein
MYRDLAGSLDPSESEMALEFEEAGLVTLGFAYEERPRLSGGAYAPILRKVDALLEEKLSKALPERERRARVVLEFDDAVTEAARRLKERGFDSPYLKPFVVARVNPLRFMKGAVPPFDALFEQMTKRARGMDPAKVRGEDVARSGGVAEAE